jgi:hypothetical protein
MFENEPGILLLFNLERATSAAVQEVLIEKMQHIIDDSIHVIVVATTISSQNTPDPLRKDFIVERLRVQSKL